MSRRRLQFEACERRDLLAADLQVWHDPSPITDPPAQPGDEVTRVVRIFNNGDQPALAEINSSLTAELDSPTWQRQRTRGRDIHDVDGLTGGQSADFAVRGMRTTSLASIGDINGDGKPDLALAEPAKRRQPYQIHVLLGGMSDGGDLASAAVKLSWRPTEQWLVRPDVFSKLGDLDGDGFGDFAIHGRIIWGRADLSPGTTFDVDEDSKDYLQITDVDAIRGVGDVNGDGHMDVVAHSAAGSSVIWGSSDARQSGERTLAAWAEQRSLPLQGHASLAAPAGDLNNDGFADLVVSRHSKHRPSPGPVIETVVTVVFGGAELADADSIDLDNVTPGSGFGVQNLIDATVGEFDYQAVQAQGGEDVNGDGVDDLLIGFDGGRCVSGCDPDRADSKSGVILVLGGSSLGDIDTVDAVSERVISYRITAKYETTHPPRLADVNGDGRADIMLHTSGTSYIIFGQQDLTHRDFSHDGLIPGSGVRYQGFNGSDGFMLQGAVRFIDVDADGVADAVATRAHVERPSGSGDYTMHVYLAAGAEPDTELVVGSGDIAEMLHVPAGEGVVYVATGKLRTPDDASIVSRVAVADARPAETLSDNTAGGVEAERLPHISTEISANGPLVPGQRATVEVTLENFGPVDANDLHISENITALFESPTWTRNTQAFPATVPRHRVGEFGGFSLVANSNDPSDESIPPRFDFPVELGDINADGYTDVWLGPGPRIVLGGPEFGDTGSLNSGGGQLLLESAHWITTLQGIGDVNQDGVDDMAGAYYTDSRQQWFIILGDATWDAGGGVRRVSLDTNNQTLLHGDIQQVSSLGDLDGDGQVDLAVVSAERYFIMLASEHRLQQLQTGLPVEHGIAPPAWRVQHSGALMPVGDINADGFDDVVVRWQPEGQWEVRANLLFGVAEGHALANSVGAAMAWSDVADAPGMFLPGDVFMAGDVNGDGRQDLVAAHDDTDDGGNYVIYGGENISVLSEFNPGELDGSNGFQWLEAPSGATDPGRGEFPSRQLTSVADINGDGFDDLITSHGDAPCVAGPLYVYYGTPSLEGQTVRTLPTDGRQGFRLTWEPSDFSVGLREDSCLAVPDMNADGAADIVLVGGSEPRPYIGTLYTLMGQPTKSLSGTGALETALALPAGARVTYRVEGVLRADLNSHGSASVSIKPTVGSLTLSPASLSDTLMLAAHSADLNADGRVDFADFLMLSENYGRDDVQRSKGDINGDGRVDFADFLILREQYAIN